MLANQCRTATGGGVGGGAPAYNPAMQFAFTDEQEQLRSTVRRFLADKSPPTEVRRLMETESGYDAEVWRQIANDLGLTAVHIPETCGGQGFSFAELAIIVEEMGRSLLCSPFFSSTVLGATAIMETGSTAQQEQLLPAVATGESLATLAVAEPSGRWDADGIAATVRDGKLTGTKSFVIDGHIADLLVVVARDSQDKLSFHVAAADSPGIVRRPLATLDPTRKLAQVDFESVPVTRLGADVDGEQALARILDLAAVALANEMVGGAQWLLESAVEYAKLRTQFGRAIGSFQAIKHKCADMLLEVELAKSAAYYAAEAASENDPELPVLACMAKSAAADAYMHAARECIQIHGGIGFTWDNDTHLWFKRAKSSEVLFGTPSLHRERMMSRIRGALSPGSARVSLARESARGGTPSQERSPQPGSARGTPSRER